METGFHPFRRPSATPCWLDSVVRSQRSVLLMAAGLGMDVRGIENSRHFPVQPGIAGHALSKLRTWRPTSCPTKKQKRSLRRPRGGHSREERRRGIEAPEAERRQIQPGSWRKPLGSDRSQRSRCRSRSRLASNAVQTPGIELLKNALMVIQATRSGKGDLWRQISARLAGLEFRIACRSPLVADPRRHSRIPRKLSLDQSRFCG